MTRKLQSGSNNIWGFVLPLTLTGFVILIALAIVISVGFASRSSEILRKTGSVIQPDPTIGWKNYQDPEFGFSMSYPNGWIVEDVTNREEDKELLRVLFFRPEILPPRLFQIEIEDNKRPNLAIVGVLIVSTEPFDTVVTKVSSYEMANVSEQEIIVGNIYGVKIEGDSPVWDHIKKQSTTQRRIVIVLPHGSKTITFSFIPKPINAGEDYSGLLPEMLKSFVIQ